MARNAHINNVTKSSDLQRLLLMATIILIVCCVTGCGKKKIEYNSEENTTDEIEQVDVEIDDSLNSPNINIAEALGVEDVLKEKLDVNFSSTKTIDINANVVVPDTNSLKLVSAEEKQFDEAYKKEMIEALSDGEIYYFDDAHLTKKEYMEQIALAEQGISNMQGDDFVGEEFYDNMNAQLQELNELYQNAPDNYVVATDYSVDAYKIEIDGIEYEIRFNKSSETSYKEISLTAIRPADFLNESYRDNNYYYVSNAHLSRGGSDEFENNSNEYTSQTSECSLELEDVVKQAEDFLKEIGIEGFKAVSSSNLIWDPGSERLDDGCSLMLYRYIDGVKVDGSYYETERIELDINDKGVIRFSYYNPLEIKEVVEDDTNLLPYESAKSSMLEELSNLEQSDDIRQSPDEKVIKFNELELLYYRCKESDESNEFLIVPVWRLINNGMSGIERCIMINAIDGSYTVRE